MYVGKNFSHQDVNISQNAPNKSILITGISGSGKSWRVADIEYNIVKKNGTVIAIDYDGTHPNVPEEFINRISAQDDGIAIRILDCMILKEAPEELARYVSTLAEVLLSGMQTGPRQIGALREAILFALKNRAFFLNDFEAIEEGLNIVGTNIALSVKERLWPLFRSNLFRKSSRILCEGKLNIISLAGIDSELKKVVIEIFLKALWNQTRLNKTKKRLSIIIDEFQNISLGKRSTVLEILREGRKYDLNVILATQTMASVPKQAIPIINQAAVHLYFQPAHGEIKKLAKRIDDDCEEKIVYMLKKLKLGESLVTGTLEIGGKIISSPIIIKTDFKSYQNKNVTNLVI